MTSLIYKNLYIFDGTNLKKKLKIKCFKHSNIRPLQLNNLDDRKFVADFFHMQVVHIMDLIYISWVQHFANIDLARPVILSKWGFHRPTYVMI